MPSSYDDISYSLPRHIFFVMLSFLRPFMYAKGFRIYIRTSDLKFSFTIFYLEPFELTKFCYPFRVRLMLNLALVPISVEAKMFMLTLEC